MGWDPSRASWRRQGWAENVGSECRGLGNPRRRREPGAGGQGPMTHHFHVFPREVLDLLLHPLDALQQILILLVHSLVLLHKGLQLDLRLSGAFQLRSERHTRPLALRPSGLLASNRGGQQGASLGLGLPPLGPHFLDGTDPRKIPHTPGSQTRYPS